MKEFILWALVEYKKLSKIESPKDINLKIFTEVISVNCNSIYICFVRDSDLLLNPFVQTSYHFEV
jgi:hypothetical protein